MGFNNRKVLIKIKNHIKGQDILKDIIIIVNMIIYMLLNIEFLSEKSIKFKYFNF
jgi:hypothetical protein